MVEPWDFATRPWISVVNLRTGAGVYLGTSVSGAAEALRPGTCYATGVSQTQARRLAEEERQRFSKLDQGPPIVTPAPEAERKIDRRSKWYRRGLTMNGYRHG